MAELIISNLSKTYTNGIKAIQDISLSISNGMFGLLGPNGAGKSTLMRTIATLQDPDAGRIQLGAINVVEQKREMRKVLGYLPQEFGVYPRISANRLLHHLAILKGLTHNKTRNELVNALLHKVNLYDVRKQKLGGFSGGMKRRFGIAQALLNNPKVLIADEPTAGLDPLERHRFFNLLSEISENTIVILSTHIVDDVKELCSQTAIIKKGEIVAQGDPKQMIQNLQGKIYRKAISKQDIPKYKDRYQVISDRMFLGKTMIHVLNEGNPGAGFEPIDASLEDVYMNQIIQD